MIDFYLVAWWLNEIAQPIAIISAVLFWLWGKKIMNDLALIEMGIVILVAAGGGAVAYGMLRQQVLGNRRDLDKLDQRIIKLDDDQGETNVELF